MNGANSLPPSVPAYGCDVPGTSNDQSGAVAGQDLIGYKIRVYSHVGDGTKRMAGPPQFGPVD